MGIHKFVDSSPVEPIEIVCLCVELLHNFSGRFSPGSLTHSDEFSVAIAMIIWVRSGTKLIHDQVCVTYELVKKSPPPPRAIRELCPTHININFQNFAFFKSDWSFRRIRARSFWIFNTTNKKGKNFKIEVERRGYMFLMTRRRGGGIIFPTR